jgi:hypothetical protein
MVSGQLRASAALPLVPESPQRPYGRFEEEVHLLHSPEIEPLFQGSTKLTELTLLH